MASGWRKAKQHGKPAHKTASVFLLVSACPPHLQRRPVHFIINVVSAHIHVPVRLAMPFPVYCKERWAAQCSSVIVLVANLKHTLPHPRNKREGVETGETCKLLRT